MSELKIKLTGWQAIAVVVVFIGIFGIRLMTFNDERDDADLMRQIELQLMTDYFPDDVEKLKAAYETGDMDEVEEVAQSITSTTLNVESVKASYPLFDLSTPKDVVVKVTYSLNDDSGTREKATNYYLFKQGYLGNIWTYKHETSVVSYYLNFI
jgi:hypothetical protein